MKSTFIPKIAFQNQEPIVPHEATVEKRRGLTKHVDEGESTVLKPPTYFVRVSIAHHASAARQSQKRSMYKSIIDPEAPASVL
jgi:hypothetical protein